MIKGRLYNNRKSTNLCIYTIQCSSNLENWFYYPRFTGTHRKSDNYIFRTNILDNSTGNENPTENILIMSLVCDPENTHTLSQF